VAAAILLVGTCLVLANPAVAATTGEADSEAADPAKAAVDFLLTRQLPGGGFGDTVVTAATVSAIAQQAQTSATWSTKAAIDAVSAAETSAGTTPLNALDAAAQSDPSPELAAQIISRAVVAMGLDPENFDPGGDGDPIDLVHIVAAGRREDGSYGSLLATAEAVLALVQVEKPVNAATVGFLEDAQQRNGGWNEDGDSTGSDVDPTTTGLVSEALVAAGVPAVGDTSVSEALAFLARNQDAEGGWPAERGGEVDTVATAWGMGTVRANGYDPAVDCWRDANPAEGDYVAPATALTAKQGPHGAFVGGADPVMATALGVQGLLGRWLPTSRAEVVSCGDGKGGGLPVAPSVIVLIVVGLVLVVGALRIMRSSGG
jgi:hypothetical protein